MGDFIYYDIFATKGMDYLIAIIGVLLLIVFWKWLNRPGESGERAAGWRASLLGVVAVIAVLVVMVAAYNLIVRLGADSMPESAGLAEPPVLGFDLSAVPDGTFRGESRFGSFVCLVDVTVKKHSITAVEIVDNEKGSNSPEGREIAGRVLKQQTPYVSTVSGATISTKAFLRAVENALNGAIRHGLAAAETPVGR